MLGTDFLPIVFSPLTPVGGIPAPIAAIDLVLPPTPTSTSTSGCEASDFSPAYVTGKFALLQDAGCSDDVKNQNAAAAGAVGAIVFREGQPGHTEVITASVTDPSAASSR